MKASHIFPRFVPVADHALLVEFADSISDDIANRVLALDHAISASPPDGLCEVVPALVNLLIDFDPLVTDHSIMQSEIEALIPRASAIDSNIQTHEVELCYDADLAPDLGAVAHAAGMSEEAVIACHLSASYRVGMYGFAPGYAYLTGVSEQIQLPRKQVAVRDVPAGSVIIAGPQCLVTTLTMPTGWSIIGRSPTEILRNDPDRPFLFDVGDTVRFKRIDRNRFDALNTGNQGAISHG
ncbi:allophanate hydrolase subunit 1 [Aliiroseovarius sp. KMU-50]|uniref:Allophanate hydrolase subunit 1 n=1 Tax=Aliiroseovarius salicola TaxID=3009082 RepID=A0ABT4W0U3_9RHOB|nr:allophanate hydrolase subunit 1 [Aliiroseovarius sp. KMU-50]MDA5094124.1 allophanate hydrolase subunit 1 [Aliiroseovarius sp. KMU-50]